VAVADRLLEWNRFVELEGAANFRDLGGYACANGVTATAMLFRADTLSALTPGDFATVMSFGLRTVVDLRHDFELQRFRSAFEGHPAVRYLHAPVALPKMEGYGKAAVLLEGGLGEFYCNMLDASAAAFRVLFERLADARSYPMVFHCTHGRDRTGMAAALVLAAAGVSQDDIIADFLISNERLQPQMASWREELAAKGVDVDSLDLFELRADHLQAAFAHLDRRYGGLQPYLRSTGVGDRQVAAFRRLFVR